MLSVSRLVRGCTTTLPNLSTAAFILGKVIRLFLMTIFTPTIPITIGLVLVRHYNAVELESSSVSIGGA